MSPAWPWTQYEIVQGHLDTGQIHEGDLVIDCGGEVCGKFTSANKFTPDSKELKIPSPPLCQRPLTLSKGLNLRLRMTLTWTLSPRILTFKI